MNSPAGGRCGRSPGIFVLPIPVDRVRLDIPASVWWLRSGWQTVVHRLPGHGSRDPASSLRALWRTGRARRNLLILPGKAPGLRRRTILGHVRGAASERHSSSEISPRSRSGRGAIPPDGWASASGGMESRSCAPDAVGNAPSGTAGLQPGCPSRIASGAGGRRSVSSRDLAKDPRNAFSGRAVPGGTPRKRAGRVRRRPSSRCLRKDGSPGGRRTDDGSHDRRRRARTGGRGRKTRVRAHAGPCFAVRQVARRPISIAIHAHHLTDELLSR